MKYFAKVYVLSEEEAENIVQDIFTDLWEKREWFDVPVNPVAYLFTSVKNRCLNYLHHQTIKKETTDQIREEHRLAMQASLNSLKALDEDIFFRQELGEVINRALDSLPEHCRRIFIMSKIEGKKQKEIAAELNISIHTVETQMGIAYKKLRAELKRQ